MYVSDNLVYVTTLLLALIFSLGAFDFPLKTNGNTTVKAGEITSYIRIVIFPYLAAMFWFIMASFSNALNNCVSGFNGTTAGCFTSPTFATTTASVFPDAAGQIEYYAFFGLFLMFLVIGIALTFYFAFRPIQAQAEGPTASGV